MSGPVRTRAAVDLPEHLAGLGTLLLGERELPGHDVREREGVVRQRGAGVGGHDLRAARAQGGRVGAAPVEGQEQVVAVEAPGQQACVHAGAAVGGVGQRAALVAQPAPADAVALVRGQEGQVGGGPGQPAGAAVQLEDGVAGGHLRDRPAKPIGAQVAVDGQDGLHARREAGLAQGRHALARWRLGGGGVTFDLDAAHGLT